MGQGISLIIESLRYGFIIKALVVGSLIAVCCSVLGIFLVLKKYSLIGDGLAHVSFATAAIALLLSTSPVLVSIPLVVLSSFIILNLNEKAEIHGDAAIGLISSFAIAIGVLISSLAKGFNVDLFSYLFGSILSISNTDVYMSVALSLVVLLMVFLNYKSLFAITYDEEFAHVSGIKVRTMNRLIAVLTSITIVLGIRIVGTMLISSLIVFPAVTALQVATSFKGCMILSSVISVICVVLGVFISFALNLPAGATIVLLNAVFFVVFYMAKK